MADHLMQNHSGQNTLDIFLLYIYKVSVFSTRESVSLSSVAGTAPQTAAACQLNRIKVDVCHWTHFQSAIGFRYRKTLHSSTINIVTPPPSKE